MTAMFTRTHYSKLIVLKLKEQLDVSILKSLQV
jgi:hypothetical protein